MGWGGATAGQEGAHDGPPPIPLQRRGSGCCAGVVEEPLGSAGLGSPWRGRFILSSADWMAGFGWVPVALGDTLLHSDPGSTTRCPEPDPVHRSNRSWGGATAGREGRPQLGRGRMTDLPPSPSNNEGLGVVLGSLKSLSPPLGWVRRGGGASSCVLRTGWRVLAGFLSP